jgi:hypothetical protein
LLGRDANAAILFYEGTSWRQFFVQRWRLNILFLAAELLYGAANFNREHGDKLSPP